MIDRKRLNDAVNRLTIDEREDADAVADAVVDALIEDMESVHGREELRQFRDRVQ